ncbi:MAG: DNA polymerase [Roseburia sp.]|nr:DNA polymerase [Roseburia sp.]
MRTKYHIIKSKSELKKLIQACKKTGYASVDFETNGEKIYNREFKPTIVSVTFMPGFGCSIPLDHFETSQYTEKGWNWKKMLKLFGREVIENRDVVKMSWNGKFDFQIFERYNIYLRGTMLDGMLAKYLLNEEKPNGLKDMVDRYIPEASGYEADKGFDKIPWDEKPLEPLCQYGCQDTDYTFRLMLFFEKKLMDLGMYALYRNLIMPASRVLQAVEKNGLYLDRAFNQKLLEEYKPKIEQALENIYGLPKVKKYQKKYNDDRVDKYIGTIEKEIEELQAELSESDDAKKSNAILKKITSRETRISNVRAGVYTNKKERELLRRINLNSTTDLPLLMYSEEGFKFPILKRTDSGNASTDEETLVELRMQVTNPESPKAKFLDNLLELRGLEKMYKTYIEGWHEKVQDDDCLHGKFNIHGTTSGRLSSAEPNLQQIPKTSVDPNIKKQLVARPGTLYMAMDFSQAELRIMAHLSGDETYLKAFREGQDPHLAIAAKKYDVPYEVALAAQDDDEHPDHKLWKNRRKQAKQIAFGIIYGIQAKLLAQKLSDVKAGLIVSPQEAQQALDEFFQEHPKIKKFMQNQEKLLRKQGYVASLFGRKRRLPQIYSDDSGEAAYAVRLAVNMPCQSAASDMCLFGSILLFWLMRQGKFPQMPSVTLVHDANYFNPDPKDINLWIVYQMWDIFRNPSTKEFFGFSIDDVDMSMDFGIGRSMAEELPFIPGYDYSKMLEPDFSVEEYMEEHKKFKGIEIKDYPKLFPKEFKRYEEYYRTK